MAFNLVSPNKKLSQLIAQSWLDGQRLTIDKKFLVDSGLFSAEEAQYIEEIQVDENPPGPPYIGTVTMDKTGSLQIYVPYPARPTEVENEPTDEQLTRWVSSPLDSEPYLPGEINQWIPYSCC
jgi:hypothetical protein